MKKTQLKALATTIHGLAVKSTSGKKPVQNKALEKIATLLNQAIEAEINQAHTSIASHVRGLAEKLEPEPARRAGKRKKVTRKKPVATKKKPPARRGRANRDHYSLTHTPILHTSSSSTPADASLRSHSGDQESFREVGTVPPGKRWPPLAGAVTHPPESQGF